MSEQPLGHITLKVHQLEPGERIEQAWVAGVPWSQTDSFRGRLSKFGGTLVLTNQRLLFEPLKPPRLKPGGPLTGWDLMFLQAAKGLDPSQIVSVEPFGTKPPPRLKLRLGTGEELVLAVMPSRRSTMFSKGTSARDEAISSISAAAAGRSGV